MSPLLRKLSQLISQSKAAQSEGTRNATHWVAAHNSVGRDTLQRETAALMYARKGTETEYRDLSEAYELDRKGTIRRHEFFVREHHRERMSYSQQGGEYGKATANVVSCLKNYVFSVYTTRPGCTRAFYSL